MIYIYILSTTLLTATSKTQDIVIVIFMQVHGGPSMAAIGIGLSTDTRITLY